MKGLSASPLKCPYNIEGNTGDNLRVVTLRFSSYEKQLYYNIRIIMHGRYTLLVTLALFLHFPPSLMGEQGLLIHIS